MNCVVLFNIMILLSIELIQASQARSDGVINRDMPNQVFDSFSKTNDKFTNPDKAAPFCKRRNAICTGLNCGNCVCSSDNTFISYAHGCMNKSQSDSFFKVSVCMQHEANATSIPAVGIYTFDVCQELISPSDIDSSKLCTIQYLEKQNVINGSLEKINNKYFTLKVQNGVNCIKGESFLPGGLVYKLSIQCPSKHKQSLVDTCFILKNYGKFLININEIPVSTTSPPKTTTSFPTTIENINTTKLTTPEATTQSTSISTVTSTGTIITTTKAVTTQYTTTQAPSTTTTSIEPVTTAKSTSTVSSESSTSTTAETSTSVTQATPTTAKSPTTSAATSATEETASASTIPATTTIATSPVTRDHTSTISREKSTVLAVKRESSEGGSSTIIVVIIAVLVAIIAIIGAVFLIVKRRKRGHEKGTDVKYSNDGFDNVSIKGNSSAENDPSEYSVITSTNSVEGTLGQDSTKLYDECNTYNGVIYSKAKDENGTPNALYEESQSTGEKAYDQCNTYEGVSYSKVSNQRNPQAIKDDSRVILNAIYDESQPISLYETAGEGTTNTTSSNADDFAIQNVLYEGSGSQVTSLYEEAGKGKTGDDQRKSENMYYASNTMIQANHQGRESSSCQQNNLYSKNENIMYEAFNEQPVVENPLYG